MLPTDWYKPTRPTLARISDSRASHFWDKRHLIAGELKQQLHDKRPSCCENSGILWDMVALYPQGVKWGSSAPIFDDGPVYKVAPALKRQLAAFEIGAQAQP